jgi:hypothetical protein
MNSTPAFLSTFSIISNGGLTPVGCEEQSLVAEIHVDGYR